MKKLIYVLCVLPLITLFLSTAHAGIITYDALTSDSGVTIAKLNDSFNIVYNEFNGNVATNNILDATLIGDDFANAASPEVRGNENIGEYVFTGLTLPTTGTTTTANISAGTAYITNDSDSRLKRVVTAIKNIGPDLTATQDNWVFLDSSGTFTVSAVGVGASQPATPANSIVLGFITTSGTNVDSATEDARQTVPPGLRIYSDMKQGLVIRRSAARKVGVGRGSIEFGSAATNGLRRNTSEVEADFAVSGRSGLDTGTQAANTYYYVWAYPDPDNSSNFEVLVSTSSTDPTTVTDVANERLIGWVYSVTTTLLSVDSVGADRLIGGDAPNFVQQENTAEPVSSTTTAELFATKFNASGGRDVEVKFDASFNRASGSNPVDLVVAISMDGTSLKKTRSGIWESGGNASKGHVSTTHIEKTVAGGPHTFTVNFFSTEGTVNLQGTSTGDFVQTFIVEEK